MAKVCLLLLTYAKHPESPRVAYAKKTIESALMRIHSQKHDIIVHIADDGSFPGHVDDLVKIAHEYTPYVTTTNANRGGYGASYNLATQVVHYLADYILPLEDDWELTQRFDIDPLIDALDAGLNCIRLGYLGWTQPLTGTVVGYANQTFLMLHPDCQEPHVWSGHPRLETKAFQCQVGPWPEGLDAGTTEFLVSQRREARQGVVWPLDLAIRAGQIQGTLFAHIGAVQAREDQNVGV